MKYYLITYGCQMNHADSERIAAILASAGYKKSAAMGHAHLIMVNMCSVGQSAVNRIYGLIPKFQKLKIENCKLKIVLTGCVLKNDRKKFSKIFDSIINIVDIKNIQDIQDIQDIKDFPLRSKIHDRGFLTADENGGDNMKILPEYPKALPEDSNSKVALVPIMTGCNNFCAYCVVPYVRGKETSRPAKEILCEVKRFVQRDYREIWLLGQNVNSYKSKIQNLKSQINPNDQNSKIINFPKLLKMVNDIPGDFWIRFTSPHPKDFSDELISVMARCEKYGHYLNLPVQAGDNAVLKKMNRHYTVAQYKNLVKKIRKIMPDIAISTDIIVGFPGETKKQFQNSVKLFQEIKYDMAYIAEYSPRPGTVAAKMENDVPQKEKARRKEILNTILKKTALEHNKKHIGQMVEALVIEKTKDFYIGKTKEYKTIKINQKLKRNKFLASKSKNQKLIGNFVKAKVIDATPWGLRGNLIL